MTWYVCACHQSIPKCLRTPFLALCRVMALFGTVTIGLLIAMSLSEDCGCNNGCEAAQKVRAYYSCEAFMVMVAQVVNLAVAKICTNDYRR